VPLVKSSLKADLPSQPNGDPAPRSWVRTPPNASWGSCS